MSETRQLLHYDLLCVVTKLMVYPASVLNEGLLNGAPSGRWHTRPVAAFSGPSYSWLLLDSFDFFGNSKYLPVQ